MQKYLIIVAGGTGSRMQQETPKQFLKINNREIILHTIDCFTKYDTAIKIIICCHKDFINHTEELLAKNNYAGITIVEGGDTRFHSVKNGLKEIEDNGSIVGIHDAARPLVSVDTITKAFDLAKEKGNAIPVIELSESIREVHGATNKMANRSAFKLVQTPQCFHASIIKNAFEQNYDPAFTDDASVAEKVGHEIYLSEGNKENIKITVPSDLIIAEALLKKYFTT